MTFRQRLRKFSSTCGFIFYSWSWQHRLVTG